MQHIVLKPFLHSTDGIRCTKLVEGDQRDFGALAHGLLKAGFIGPIEPDPVPAPAPEEPVLAAEPATEEPASDAVDPQPRTRSRRRAE